jgi:hypothetical protein
LIKESDGKPSRIMEYSSIRSDSVLQYSATPLLHLSTNDAGFLKAEIAAAATSRRTDDDVIDQLELEDSAGLENSPGEAQIGLRSGRISGYAACGITGVIPYPVLCRMLRRSVWFFGESDNVQNAA